MTEQDKSTAFRPLAQDVATTMALLTRLPVRAKFDRTAQAVWAFPLAGLAVALIAGAVATIAIWLSLGSALTAALAIATGVIVTGAMHEDGLADSADGLWGGWHISRRLEIMRDSRIGTYGVLALILALLIRFSALSAVAHAGVIVPALLAAAMLSRAVIPFTMTLLPHARTDGLSVQTGRPPRRAAVLAALLGLALSWIVVGFVPMVLAASACAATGAIAGAVAKAKIGGQTGDILGATQLLCELAALVTFAALAA
ncbi:adenosylcobinamide-GDP ribazoletransferase [Celeribacter sp.]|uniref:adenosylcobinamide-GDP ribazoletransferase n=1 Tax=Celeribacter sp. TaxID=1890673 RepID=UPI003A922B43